MENENAGVAGNNQGTPVASEETQTLNSPVQVEGDGNAPEANGQGKKSFQFDPEKFYINNKRVTDELRQGMKRLEDLVQQRLAPPSQPQPASTVQDFDWSNPRNEIQRTVKETIHSELKPVLEQERIVDRQARAKEYLLSQDYIDTNNLEAVQSELDAIYADPRYGFTHSWSTNPEQAAEGILEIYKTRKGIGRNTPSKAMAPTVPGGQGIGSNAKKVWTSKEVNSLSMADYDKLRDDIEAAYKEGRWRD